MLLFSVSMALIVLFFVLYSHFFFAPADQLSPVYGPYCTSKILKPSNLDNSLVNPNPMPPSRSLPSRILKKFILYLVVYHGSLIAGGVAAMISLGCIIAYKMNTRYALTEGLRHFSLDEIVSATKDFNPEFCVGHGGYGKVYKGLIDDRKRVVAVKRLSWLSRQGAHEFWTEVEALSRLRHTNLVSLIGYCNEYSEKILVYDFMPRGTLAHNLCRNAEADQSLSWEQRLKICIGAARGLDYLHTGTDREVIHRDVKSSNILLDEGFKAKISDFGMAKIMELVEQHSYVITMVKGTPGYVDPAYGTSQKLTRKSDVYSFGVVLFEVLCGRKALKSRNRDNQLELISWARGLIRDGHMEKIVDPCLEGKISPKSLEAFVEVSEKCLHDEPKKRPTMVQVVAQLELLLEPHVGKYDVEMVQDIVSQSLEVPSTATQPNVVESAPSGTEPNIGETSISDSTSSYGLWPREPSRINKELMFPDGPCHCFSDSDIITATENFSNNNIVIHDGLYTIYRGGCSARGKSFVTKNVAIARIDCAKHGMPDISTELQRLSCLDHPNLAPIVGYCYSGSKIIIVCEYNGLGTLLQHLKSNLPLKRRLNICIDAARALRYLHMGTGVKIIHGDISTTTILLDKNWGAKVVHFGSILSHLSARNAGELELMPSEFADPTKLTEKSDVYLFGLLLLVVFCGKEAYYEYRVGRYPLRLPGKVREAMKTGTLSQITNMTQVWVLEGDSIAKFLQVAFSCLSPEQDDRPSMDTVVESLKKALSLLEEERY